MSPSRRPRRLLPAALVAAVAAAVGAGAALLIPRGVTAGGSDPGARPVAPAASTASGPRAPQLPQVSLGGLRWGDFHGIELPSAAGAGPRDTVGGLASGFSDTPLGALLAAANIAVRANPQWGPPIFTPTIVGQVTGPDAAALLSSCQEYYAQASHAAHITGGSALGNVNVSEEAFRWVSYTPSDATVDLVSAQPGSQGAVVRASVRIEVAWSGGDWRVVAPPGGDWGDAAVPLHSLSGYTLFHRQG